MLKKFLFRILAVLGGSFVVLGALAFLSNAMQKRRISPSIMNPNPPLLTYDSVLGWNSIPEIKPLKNDRPGSVVVFTGDSFTQSAEWANLTQEKLLDKKIPIEGYNLGVSGYGTLQAYLKLRRFVDQKKPAVVLHQFFVWNDMRDNYQHPALIYNYLMQHRPYLEKSDSGFHVRPLSWQYRWLRRLPFSNYSVFINSIKAPPYMYYTLKDAWGPFYQAKFQSSPYVQGAWEATEQALLMMKKLSREYGFQLVVLGLDNGFTVDPDVYDAAFDDSEKGEYDRGLPLKRLTRLTEKLDLEFIDCQPHLLRKRKQSQTKIYSGPPGNLSGHLTMQGEEILAELAAEAIASKLMRPQ